MIETEQQGVHGGGLGGFVSGASCSSRPPVPRGSDSVTPRFVGAPSMGAVTTGGVSITVSITGMAFGTLGSGNLAAGAMLMDALTSTGTLARFFCHKAEPVR